MSSRAVSRRRFLQAAATFGAALSAPRGALAQRAGRDVAGAVVRHPSASPIVSARVTLSRTGAAAFAEVRTDQSGRYAIPDVPEGTYRLGASAPGLEYREVHLLVEASSGSPIEVDFALAPDTHPGRWDILGDPGEALGGTNSAALLPDGRIMYCHDTLTPMIFDPVARASEHAPTSGRLQGCHAVTLLADGRLLYVGGAGVPIYGPGTRQVKTYDPVGRRWQVSSELNEPRWYPTLVPLADGELLAVGGGGAKNPIRVATSEVMDPRSMGWKPAGDIAIGNEVSPVVLLHSGQVLMTHRPPQLFDPGTRRWRLAADFVQGNRMPNGDHCDHEIVLTADGRVVAVGFKSFTPGTPGHLVEIYDPARNAWSVGADWSPVRSRASVVQLPDGTVLVLGGFKEERGDPAPVNPWGQLRLTDLYDPRRDTWRRLADLNIAREYHATPVLVPDGRVLVAGGEAQPGVPPPRSQVEAFSPPYLFRGPRPVILHVSATSLKRGEDVRLTVAGTTSVTSVVLMGTSARTHFMNSGNGRYLELPFVQTEADLVARIPSERALAVLGYYLLFVLVDGIPSVGAIVRITG